MRILAALSIAFMLVTTAAWAISSVPVTSTVSIGTQTGGGCSGASCKTFFITTTGSDTNNGLSKTQGSGCPTGSTGTCGPWATPHGAATTSTTVRCSATGGDTILVEPGVYNNAQFDGNLATNTRANFPPIDTATCVGHGVFRTIKCDGPTLGSCVISTPSFHWGFWLDSSYWIVQGFQATTTTSTGNACFVANYQPNFSPYDISYNAHDVIFVNNWGHDCQRAGVSNTDYTAVIGMINYNNAGGATDSAEDQFEPWAFDTLTDTHIFVAGAFIMHSTITDQDTDGEGIIMDDWAFGQCHPPATGCQSPYTGLGVISQSMVIGNASEGIEKLNGGATASLVYSTTFWNNNQSNETNGNAYTEVGSQSGGGVGAQLNIDHVLAVATRATNTWHNVSPITSGSTSGTTFTVTAKGGAWIGPNAALTGGTPALPAGTTVTAFVSGSPGQIGTYTISCPGGCPSSTSGSYTSNGFSGPNFQPNFPINALGTNASGMSASNTAYFNSANPAQSCNQSPFGGGCTVTFTNSVQADPLFASPAIPGGTFTTGVGGTGPDCSTFATTTACARSVGIIANFKPTNTNSIVQAAGYPDPAVVACGQDAAIQAGHWPNWIPQSIWQNFPSGLVVLPCGNSTVPVVSSVSPNTGPTTGGTAVTISGSNFASGATVTVGGTNATVSGVNTSVTPNTINITTPAGTAGTVDTLVTTSGGTSAANSNDQFTYTGGGGTGPVVTAAAVHVISASGLAGNTNVPITTVTTAGTSTSVSGLIATNSSGNLTSCAITSDSRGFNTNLFTITTSGTSCLLKTAAGGLSGGGYAYLPITATNSSGTSLVTMISADWRTASVAGSLLNVISGTIPVVIPAGAPVPNGQILGRLGMDSTPGVPMPSSCTITSGNGSGLFQVVATTGGKYFCVIETATASFPASGSASLTITATNTNGTGTAGTATITWSTVSSSAPVIAQQACTATTGSITNGQTLCTVTMTNSGGNLSGCTLSGDPGNPSPYFSIAPGTGTGNSSTCVIKATAALASQGAASLGSPVLFITATNSSGTSIGGYAVIALGPISDPGTATAAATAAHNAGYTQLVLNDSTMTAPTIDFNDSVLPGFHWYGASHQFSGQWPCDVASGAGGCRNSGAPSDFYPFQDQDGDPAPTIWPSVSGGLLSFPNGTTAVGGYLFSCAQFGFVPNNMQFPVIGNAYANGYYYDTQMQASDTSVAGPGAFEIALQFTMNTWIPAPGGLNGDMVEIDWPEMGAGTGTGFDVNHWHYGGSTRGNSSNAGNSPAGYSTALHSYQELWIPASRNPNNDGGATDSITAYFDGVAVPNGTSGTNPIKNAPSASSWGFDSQFNCFYLGVGPLVVHSFRLWQHP